MWAAGEWHKTAFGSPFGLFQYCRLSFGLVAGGPRNVTGGDQGHAASVGH